MCYCWKLNNMLNVFKYININGCKLCAFDIIIHDTWYKVWNANVSCNVPYTCNMRYMHWHFCIAYARGHRIESGVCA